MNPKILHWSGKHVWLVGASAGIGAALARELARRGAKLALSSRSADKLQMLGIADALLLPCDASNVASLSSARGQVIAAWGRIDLVLYLAGDYEPMGADDFNLAAAEHLVDVNFLGAMRLASVVLKDLGPGSGIAFVASVAGYRGLPKSIAYGPGKAALIHFAECLYLDLSPRNIGVWVINPGFVSTRLTAKNDFDMPALLTVEQAALALVKGLGQGRFEIDFPKRFTRTMKLLAHLPYRAYFFLVRRLTQG